MFLRRHKFASDAASASDGRIAQTEAITDASRVVRIAVLAATAMVVAALVPGLARAASPYPSPPPDFAHPGKPHSPLMTPASGDNDRPVLVLYVDFTDAAAPANKGPAFFSNLFFGSSYGSVADYYRAASFGKLRLTPAAETSGTANDGVVRLTIGTQANFDAPANDGNRGRQALLAANPFVDFKSFDRNGDARVGADELLLYIVEVRGRSAAARGGLAQR